MNWEGLSNSKFSMTIHESVLLKETLSFFLPCVRDKKDKIVHIADATLGFGGHTLTLLFISNSTCVIDGIDADAHMLEMARKRFEEEKDIPHDAVHFHHEWYDNFFINAYHKNKQYDGIIIDLGPCMYHFKDSKRGFSRHGNESLDMRFNGSSNSNTAMDIINTYSRKELSDMIYKYSEERACQVWANRIVNMRKGNTIKTTTDLLTALQLGKKSSDASIITRIFQALRIEVNDELARIQRALPHAWNVLVPGGRLAVISFHSLEDRIIKKFFKYVEGSLKNIEEIPIYDNNYAYTNADTDTCVAINLTPTVIVSSSEEILSNPSSRGAKLRVIEKKKL